MANDELVRTMDYILNRCGAAEIEAVAAAVVRRKRDLALFGESHMLDPRSFAKKAAEDLTLGVGGGLEMVRKTVRDMAAGMLRREAPELGEDQIEELLDAWVPDGTAAGATAGAGARHQDSGSDGSGSPDPRNGGVPADVLMAMVDQFVAYSTGTMQNGADEALRREMGDWPERYWRSFPAVVRSVVSEYLKGGTTEKEFRSHLRAALDIAR